MTEFKPGEIVDITLRARFVEYTADGAAIKVNHQWRTVNDTTYVSETCLRLGDDLTVERVAPANWPPRPGDLWRDFGGELWFVFRDSGQVLMIPTFPVVTSIGGWYPDQVLKQRLGPLTLVHREGNQRGPVVFEDPLTARLDEQGEVPL